MAYTFPTHIVSVGGLVQSKTGEVLLVRHTRRGWEFPGGQVEPGETLTGALAREIAEESGVAARVAALGGITSVVDTFPGYNGAGTVPTMVIVDFFCDWVSGTPRPSAETPEAKWFPPAQALELTKNTIARVRLRDLLNADGRVVYRAFAMNPARIVEEFRLPAGQNSL